MSFDEALADRIRERLSAKGYDLTEKKMFGGLSFLYKNKMTIGIVKDDLCVRMVTPDWEEELASNPHVRIMDFTKSPMKEFLFVENQSFEKEVDLDRWIEAGLQHARQKLGE
jgi:TfoX/Sxy family transcriptional regulator of competence genes